MSFKILLIFIYSETLIMSLVLIVFHIEISYFYDIFTHCFRGVGVGKNGAVCVSLSIPDPCYIRTFSLCIYMCYDRGVLLYYIDLFKRHQNWELSCRQILVSIFNYNHCQSFDMFVRLGVVNGIIHCFNGCFFYAE